MTVREVTPIVDADALLARELADGASFSSVAGLVGTELLVGVLYAAAGYGLLRFMEVQSRRYATLERS